jgi:hypothetical protein
LGRQRVQIFVHARTPMFADVYWRIGRGELKCYVSIYGQMMK